MKLSTIIWSGVLCLVAGLPAAGTNVPAPDTEMYDRVLQKYVLDDGTVRYGALKANLEPLATFVAQLREVSPHSHPELFPSRESALAYWINAYNAMVLWAFAREYPDKKDRLGGLIGRALFFYRQKFRVGGEKVSLADIENDIIRKEFKEPRIHFAIVCASTGCPWLARYAYTAENLEDALERETHRFLNQARNVKIDREKGEITLSKLFDWYGKDFGHSSQEIRAYITRYRPGDQEILRGRWKLRYFDYDWSPNDAPSPTH